VIAIDLYTYYRSTSSHRVRVALALKGLNARQIPVNPIQDAGQQLKPEYRAINPQGRIPSPSAYPKICRVERYALEHPAFIQAHLGAQADKPA